MTSGARCVDYLPGHGIRCRVGGMLTRMTQAWLRWALAYLHVFRVVVVGMCVLLAVVGWVADIQWLFMASLCIGLGEMIESTYYIVVIRWGQRTRRLV